MFTGFNTWTTNTNSNALINDNTIEITSQALIGTDTCIPIETRNINFQNICGNIINSLDAGTYPNLTHYIRSYSNPAYATMIDGSITGNIFNKSLDFARVWGGFTYDLTETMEVQGYWRRGGMGVLPNDSKIRVEFNKNQKERIDINCTEFKTYGFNEQTIQQPSLLFSGRDIPDNCDINNLARQVQIITAQPTREAGDGYIPDADWSIDPGLYYTNTWNYTVNANDPMQEGGMPGAVNKHFQNQILIPVNIPRGAQLLDVEIPIYFINLLTTDPVTLYVSGSWVFGNLVEANTLEGTQYIPDDAAGANTVWISKQVVLSARPTAPYQQKITLINNIMSAGVATGTYVNNPSWQKWGIHGPTIQDTPPPNSYIVISMFRDSSVYPETQHKISFAIPYARLTIRY